VVRKDDFDSRIRNALVVGSVESGTESASQPQFSSSSQSRSHSHDENGGTDMVEVQTPKTLEYIVLALENGTIVFLFGNIRGVHLELCTAHHTVSRPMLAEQPGRHIAADPSSRYLAVAGAENVFAIYSLPSNNSLNTMYQDGNSGAPIESERYFHVKGVIHKMEFLYPTADDPDHIILLLLVISRGTTRMFVYDWEAGQSLRDIQNHFKKGLMFDWEEQRMPHLLIPMRINSSFLLVSETSMSVCHSPLSGSPDFIRVAIKPVKTSRRYFGSNINPVWTSWFRPLRTESYSKTHDDFYIAREDGTLLFFENSVGDRALGLQMDMYVDCNIGTAFAVLDVMVHKTNDSSTYRGFVDCLVVGGDSSNGGFYLVRSFLRACANKLTSRRWKHEILQYYSIRF
jgi:hypothetical protein